MFHMRIPQWNHVLREESFFGQTANFSRTFPCFQHGAHMPIGLVGFEPPKISMENRTIQAFRSAKSGALPEIVELADRWPDLPDPIRTAILALLASEGQ
jgi:hypothetical protein